VAFSPDGKIVLTGSFDNTARLWDVATGRPLGPPMEHSGPVESVAFSPDGRSVLSGSSDAARLWDVTELPDEPERVAAGIETAAGIRLEEKDEFEILNRTALSQSRERLAKMGGSPIRKQRWSLDPILFGSEPDARARAWIERGRWEEAKAAFDEAVAARPLYAPLWAGRARFHAAHGLHGQAVEDAARAVLLCWNDPKLAALARSDAAFRDEAMRSELFQVKRWFFMPAQEIWRGRGRRRASQWDWAGAVREFDEPAVPERSAGFFADLEYACLLRLKGDHEAARRFADEVRRLPEPVTLLDPDGTPLVNHDAQMQLWVRLLDDPPPDRSDLVQRALKYVSGGKLVPKSKGADAYVVGAALLRAGRLDEAVRRFEQSLAVEPDWPNHGLNAYGLSLAHHRLGHPSDARRWLDIAERWLNRLDRIYTAQAPRVLTGQPSVPVTFEFWVYAQVLRREAAGPILDRSFPADPFAR
jgi:tetratricopeptide (TPR) repeat protein